MKILIIQLSALGDIIYTLHNVIKFYYSFKDNIEIDWLCNSKNELLINQKEINNLLIFKKNKIEDKYDIIIDFGTKRSTLFQRYKLNGLKIGFLANKKKYISFFNDYNINFNEKISVIENQKNILKFLCKLLKINFNDSYNPEINYNILSLFLNKISFFILLSFFIFHLFLFQVLLFTNSLKDSFDFFQ